jgi:hypothetical protein
MLENHHIYFGKAYRPKSEKHGLKVYLCNFHHQDHKSGVHHNKAFDNALKKLAQAKAMEHYNWSIDDFRKIFGKNYI